MILYAVKEKYDSSNNISMTCWPPAVCGTSRIPGTVADDNKISLKLGIRILITGYIILVGMCTLQHEPLWLLTVDPRTGMDVPLYSHDSKELNNYIPSGNKAVGSKFKVVRPFSNYSVQLRLQQRTEGTLQLGGSGGMPPMKFLKILWFWWHLGHFERQNFSFWNNQFLITFYLLNYSIYTFVHRCSVNYLDLTYIIMEHLNIKGQLVLNSLCSFDPHCSCTWCQSWYVNFLNIFLLCLEPQRLGPPPPPA